MRRAAATLALCLAFSGAARAGNGDTVYRDAAWRFQIEVAEGWTAKPVTQDDLPVRLIVQGPKPLDDHEVCLVYIERDLRSTGTPQAKLDRAVRGGEFGSGSHSLLRPTNGLFDAQVSSDKVVDLNGRAAQFIELSYGMQQPRQRAWVYSLTFLAPGRAFSARCLAKEGHYAAFRPVFERMLHSLKVFY